MLTGIVKRIKPESKYGFIRVGKVDYFFHKEDFDGHWDDLVNDFERDVEIEVEFEDKRTDKGLRAAEVRRTDGGVQR